MPKVEVISRRLFGTAFLIDIKQKVMSQHLIKSFENVLMMLCYLHNKT